MLFFIYQSPHDMYLAVGSYMGECVGDFGMLINGIKGCDVSCRNRKL